VLAAAVAGGQADTRAVALERKFHPYYPVIVVRSKTAAPAKAAVP